MLWKVLKKKEVGIAYITAIKNMLEGTSTSARTQDGVTNNFSITIGLHIASTLNPYLDITI